MHRALAWLLALPLLGACVAAAPPLRSLSTAERSASLAELQAGDARLARIAYRLAAAGEPICPIKAMLTGFTVQEGAQYAPELRRSPGNPEGVPEGISVLAVAPGSPGAAAGLRAGDRLLEVAGVPLVPSRTSAKPSYSGVAAAYARLESASSGAAVPLLIGRGPETLPAVVRPLPGCTSRVQLTPSRHVYARADGTVLSVSTGLLGFVADDDELALVVAHEMAHNALGHRKMLDAQGVRRNLSGNYGKGAAAAVLATERAADRLGTYLVARAGFDPEVAPRFWKRLHEGPAGWTADPRTHPNAEARIAEAQAIVAEIKAKQSAGRALTP